MFGQDTKEGVHLVVDIGNFSVGVALVYLKENHIPEIILNRRLSLPLTEKWNKEKSIDDICQNLQKLLKIVLKESAKTLHVSLRKLETKKIKNVLCIVSSPWCISKIKTYGIKEKNQTEITPKLIELITKKINLYDSETPNNTGKQGENLTKIGEKEDLYKTIEKKIIQTKLNGYVVLDPINKTAREIELSVFEGKILKKVMDKIGSTIHSQVSSNIIFHSFSLTGFAIIEEMFPEAHDYLLVEVGGEITEMTSVKDGLVTDSSYLESGKNLFLRNVIKEFAVNPDIALSFIKLFYEQRSEKTFNDKIKEVIKHSETEWMNNFKKTLYTLKEKLPLRIFLAMESPLVPFWSEFLKSQLIESPLSKNSEIISLNTKALSQFCKFSTDEPDTLLAIDTIFLDKIIR
ncbi:MAG: hypothetical protein AAB534_01010 [Patescibacteria group bacterium]